MNTQKHILITGGAGGLGDAACRAFAEAGWHVFSLDIRAPKSTRDSVTDILCDLTREEAVVNALLAVRRHTHALDCILHMAGIYHMDAFSEMDGELWQKITEVNVLSAARVNRLFLPLILEGKGRILITTSELAGRRPLPFNGVYAASKTALKAYCDALRPELYLLGIPVVEIRPGAYQTTLLDGANRAMEEMCESSRYFSHSASVFRSVMDTQMSTAKDPKKLSRVLLRAATAHRPRLSYSPNNNLLLKLYEVLPTRLGCFALKLLLKPKK
ncbi:MAG: SDR family NAD(P)-dependent oxidoreductase [Clostridia bacterium]|nr:SDR family NAD(P)-dependent oxidoreductase [Clostridia bacterium]